MMKKGKVVLAQPAAQALVPRMLSPRPPLSRAPTPVRGAGDEAAYRAGLRYRGLLQDYQELLKETEAKKRRQHMMKLMKQRLLAEVKFLRKRYKSMSQNPSQTIVCRVRNPSMPSPALKNTAWSDDVGHRSVHVVRSSRVHLRQLRHPRASPVIDLNDACEPGHEEMETTEYRGYLGPRGINNTMRYPLEGDFLPVQVV